MENHKNKGSTIVNFLIRGETPAAPDADTAAACGVSPEPGADSASQTPSNIVERNRKNARSSTGPRSEAGKRISRWNALKHGILVREAAVPVGQGKENAQQLLAILKRFRRGFDVRGLAEELVIERLAVIYWQMRRIQISEVGELRMSLDTINDTVLAEWVDRLAEVDTNDRSPFMRHFRHITHDLSLIEGLLKMVREKGRINHDAFVECARQVRTIQTKQLITKLIADADGRDLKEKRRAQILDEFESTMDLLNKSNRTAHQRGMMELAMRVGAEAARHYMPEAGAAAKIQRRESSLDQQFHRAIGELIRLQRARGGGPQVWSGEALDGLEVDEN